MSFIGAYKSNIVYGIHGGVLVILIQLIELVATNSPLTVNTHYSRLFVCSMAVLKTID